MDFFPQYCKCIWSALNYDINIIHWRNNWCKWTHKKRKQFYITNPLIFKMSNLISQSNGIFFFLITFSCHHSFLYPGYPLWVFLLCFLSKENQNLTTIKLWVTILTLKHERNLLTLFHMSVWIVIFFSFALYIPKYLYIFVSLCIPL